MLMPMSREESLAIIIPALDEESIIGEVVTLHPMRPVFQNVVFLRYIELESEIRRAVGHSASGGGACRSSLKRAPGVFSSDSRTRSPPCSRAS